MKKSNKKIETYFPYDFDNKPHPEQLIYLAISVTAIFAAFLTLILI